MSVTVLFAAADVSSPAVTALVDAGMEVHEADSLAAAEAVLADNAVDCVVTDARLPGGTGLELLETVRARAPDTPCIIYTDVPTADIDTSSFTGLVAEYLRRRDGDGAGRLRTLVDELVTRRSQVGYPLPADEDARLAGLGQYDVTGADVQETFDRLTELAVRHVGVDRAFIGVVDEHEERFVSCHGRDLDTLDRESTICTHAILEDDVMVVEDVHEDPRFEHNDALDRLDIRSYAGAPLRTPAGAAIGSFCLTDDEPRRYSDDDRTFLRLLADEAMEQLELRRRLRAADGGEP